MNTAAAPARAKPDFGETAASVRPKTALALEGVSMVFSRGNARVHALDGISLEVRDGEFIAVVGPSGCGKSTLLKLVTGLRAPTGGRIAVYGRGVAGPRGDVGIVFQNPVLLPWRTIEDNVTLPVTILGQDLAQGRTRARELLELVGLSGFERAYPSELSGGMQQRAAIARALVYDAPLLLMDEPFGALDALTREQMSLELQRIWDASRKTVLFITHSIPEAVFLADRIVVMSPRPGRILAVLDNPAPRMRSLDDMLSPDSGRLVRAIRGMLGSYVGSGDGNAGRADF